MHILKCNNTVMSCKQNQAKLVVGMFTVMFSVHTPTKSSESIPRMSVIRESIFRRFLNTSDSSGSAERFRFFLEPKSHKSTSFFIKKGSSNHSSVLLLRLGYNWWSSGSPRPASRKDDDEGERVARICGARTSLGKSGLVNAVSATELSDGELHHRGVT